MSKTLKQSIIELCIDEGFTCEDQEELYDTFQYNSNIVFKDNEDEHRWYTNWDLVREVEIDGVKRYFKDRLVDMHQEDGDAADIGWEAPDLDDLEEVFPKEVLTTIYVSKNLI